MSSGPRSSWLQPIEYRLQVFKAHLLGRPEPVAVKRIKLGPGLDKEIQRILRELGSLVALSCRFLVKFMGVFATKKGIGFVLEVCSIN